MNKKILIVGCGNIGSLLYEEYAKSCPHRYDPYKGYFEKQDGIYDIAFIAVDTPMLKDGSCDLSQVKTAVSETNADIIVLRSTVPVGTTDDLIKKTGKQIVFCPEFYGRTQHCDHKTFDFSYTIIGGNPEAREKVVQFLQSIYDARHRFLQTDAKTAELSKYMANTMLAAKVSLCVQFWEIANQLGVNYSELRELVLQDERFSRAHTFVYSDKPFWRSHCFDKDLPALTMFSNAPLIEAVIKYNRDCILRYEKNSTPPLPASEL